MTDISFFLIVFLGELTLKKISLRHQNLIQFPLAKMFNDPRFLKKPNTQYSSTLESISWRLLISSPLYDLQLPPLGTFAHQISLALGTERYLMQHHLPLFLKYITKSCIPFHKFAECHFMD